MFNLLQLMDSISRLVSVWVKNMNERGNIYENHGFVRGLKKDLRMLFLAED